MCTIQTFNDEGKNIGQSSEIRAECECVQSVEVLMAACPGLTSCLDLDYWEAISARQLATFRQQLGRDNTQLRTRDRREEEEEERGGGLAAAALLPEHFCDEEQ